MNPPISYPEENKTFSCFRNKSFPYVKEDFSSRRDRFYLMWENTPWVKSSSNVDDENFL